MKFTSKVLLTLSALTALAVSVGSCGGNSAGLTSDEGAFVGITQGDFKAVRYNDAGYRDSALNSTINMTVADQGNTTVVTVSISDADASRGVTMDLRYDPQSYSPADVNFNGLIDTPVQMSMTGISGLVAIGQVDTKSTAVRHGQFATVVFDHKPFNGGKAVLAAHSAPLDTTYTANGTNASAFGLSGAVAPVDYTVRSLFAIGDGDANGESNISDLTPIGSNFGKVVAPADLYPASADYDANGEVNISDLTPLGANFGDNTTGIEILIGDAATGGTVLETLAWTSGTAPTGNPSTATADPAATWRTWTGDVTVADCQAADTNLDGHVFVSARATDGVTPGTAFDGIDITYLALPTNFVISGIDVEITGATGGSGSGPTDFNDGDTASVVANSTATLNITGISGTYEATPFTPADAGGAVPQAEYDDALAAAQALVTWTSSTTGAAGMRSTAPVLALSGTTGTGITATVFPDDDPESSGATPEGTLAATTTVSGTFMPGALSVAVGIDVTVDDTAAVVEAIAASPDNGLDGNGDQLLSIVSNSMVTLPFSWGSGGAPGAINETSIGCDLYNFESGTFTTFTYTAGTPAAAGEFTVVGFGPYLLNALVSPSMLSQGSHYSVRIFDIGAGVFNSVNKPGNFLSVAPPPAAADLTYFPSSDVIGPDTTQITIIWPDPLLRRNPDVKIDITDGSVVPDPLTNSQEAFDDTIKDSGNEFQCGAVTGTGLFPQRTVVTGTDTASIGPNTDDTDTINQAFIITARHPDRIVADISALPAPATIGDPPSDYAFKLFGLPVVEGDQSTRPAIGFGTFSIQFQPLGEAAITPVDWGINIFSSGSRGDLDLASRSFADKSCDSTTFVAPNGIGFPDVIFVEFNGGIVGSDFAGDNVALTFTSQNDASVWSVPLKIVCAGLGVGGLNYIGCHVFDTTDLLTSGLGGNLDPGAGGLYDLSLKDGNDANPTAVTDALFVQ